MKTKNFLYIVSGLFWSIAALHLLRTFFEVEVTLAGSVVPLWVSYIVVFAMAALGAYSLKFAKKRK